MFPAKIFITFKIDYENNKKGDGMNINPKTGYEIFMGTFNDRNCRKVIRRGYVQNRGDVRVLYVPVASGGFHTAQIEY